MSVKAVILESDKEADVCFLSYISHFSFCLSVQCYYLGLGGGEMVK